jgi:hypothetical protein
LAFLATGATGIPLREFYDQLPQLRIGFLASNGRNGFVSVRMARHSFKFASFRSFLFFVVAWLLYGINPKAIYAPIADHLGKYLKIKEFGRF